mmetsp:Transcript_22947/g.33705  ORF Transcript_22947/g.33705 Transcript_22947/m.33705 type:complete len:640 (+) Transcript_22947:1592-3511(+)
MKYECYFFVELQLFTVDMYLLSKKEKSKANLALIENAVEEQIIRRTYSQFLSLVRGLISEYSGVVENGREEYRMNSASSPSTSKQKKAGKQSASEILCQAETELFACGGFGATKTVSDAAPHKKMYVSVSHCLQDIQSCHDTILENIRKIDKILQLLSTNGEICNSMLMKEFLDLVSSDSSSPTTTDDKDAHPFHQVAQQGRDKEKYHLDHKRTNYRLLNEGENIDSFVKRWLSSSDCLPEPNDHLLLQALIALQNNWIVLSITVLVLLFCLQITQFWWAKFSYSVTVRVDVLAVILAGTGYVGYKMGCQNENNVQLEKSREAKAKQSHDAEKKKVQQPRHVIVSQKSMDKVDGPIETSLVADTDATIDEEVSNNDGVNDTEDLEYDDNVDDSLIMNPLPKYPGRKGNGIDCWSKPPDTIFCVRGPTYLQDRIKIPSKPAPFKCRGVEVWNAEKAPCHIARHPSMLGGDLHKEDTFMINFVLPFGNFVSYFAVPPIEKMTPTFADVWTKFLKGDKAYRDARLKMLVVCREGPWIVKKIIGKGNAPCVLGSCIPLEYYFREPTEGKKAIYEVDIVIGDSKLATNILNMVQGHTAAMTLAFGYIIEGVSDAELPEQVMCSFQVHHMHLKQCQPLPPIVLDT